MSVWTDAVDAGVKDWEQRAEDQVMAAPRGHVTSLLQKALPHLLRPIREALAEVESEAGGFARAYGEVDEPPAVIDTASLRALLDQIENEAKQ